jgi:hypothetical protein
LGGLGATAIAYLNQFVYVGGSVVRGMAAAKASATASGTGYDEKDYYAASIMKISSDLSTTSWMYT